MNVEVCWMCFLCSDNRAYLIRPVGKLLVNDRESRRDVSPVYRAWIAIGRSF